MSPVERENQSDPETSEQLSIETDHLPDGWWVGVRRGGTVVHAEAGFKSLAAAEEAGRVYVKNLLRAELQLRHGVTKRAERPAFEDHRCPRCGRSWWRPTLCGDCGVHSESVAVGAAALDPAADWEALEQEAPQLEEAQLCGCGHLEDLHEVLAGPCATNDGRRACPCEGFTPVAQVEAVQS